MKDNMINFYPTPRELIEHIVDGIDWKNITSVLEPSAGKGDILDYVTNTKWGWKRNVEAIEINPELRAVLSDKDYRIVADDFLSYETYKKYSLIIMNPPFDNGVEHLLKAISIQKNGGKIVCILNAETLKNPYTLRRKDLLRQLEDYNADIEYMSNTFSSAERETDVEIAVVKIDIPEQQFDSYFINRMQQAKKLKEQVSKGCTDIVENDYIKAAVIRYQIEVESGLRLIQEYKAMIPYMLTELNPKKESYNYAKPILDLKVGSHDLSENEYVESVRYKYWSALFNDVRFTKAMTSEMRTNYSSIVNELKYREFTVSNIKKIQIDMCCNLVGGIENCILKLFDELSYQYSWSTEFDKNIHYYNGWATNKAWYVNKKVILPCHGAYSSIWKQFRYGFEVLSKFSDIEKAFDYLAGVPSGNSTLAYTLDTAEKNGITKNIECKYFSLTFYKKGTVHIIFKDMELLKRLNIFAGKNKNMLPPKYGKVPYEELSNREKVVVKEFDGSEGEYMKVYNEKEKYLFEAKNVLQLEVKTA